MTRVLILAVTLLMACGCSGGEPRYRLRTADHWIERRAASIRPNEWGWRPSGKTAIEALRTIGPAAVPACMRAVGSGDLSVRLAAVETLSMYGAASRPALPLLIDRTRDPQWHEYRRGDHNWDFTEAVGRALATIDPARTHTAGLLRSALNAPKPPIPQRGPGGVWQSPEEREFEAWMIREVGRIHLAYLALTLDDSNAEAREIISSALAYEDPRLTPETRGRLAAGESVRDGDGHKMRNNREGLMRALAAEAVNRPAFRRVWP